MKSKGRPGQHACFPEACSTARYRLDQMETGWVGRWGSRLPGECNDWRSAAGN